jgi:hypothetical protein
VIIRPTDVYLSPEFDIQHPNGPDEQTHVHQEGQEDFETELADEQADLEARTRTDYNESPEDHGRETKFFRPRSVPNSRERNGHMSGFLDSQFCVSATWCIY